ncbi:hypothetical protein SCAR479_05226 [Seiridium cardinale]|uniref:Uncharacterized protein n=1 Tax=Seiridium cardinale TaxID=138064 RepID=A0ABR2XX90_9PEZI
MEIYSVTPTPYSSSRAWPMTWKSTVVAITRSSAGLGHVILQAITNDDSARLATFVVNAKRYLTYTEQVLTRCRFRVLIMEGQEFPTGDLVADAALWRVHGPPL